MAPVPDERRGVLHSIVLKNILLFLAILVVAVLVAFDAGPLGPDQTYGKVERVDTIAGGGAVALVVLTTFPPDAQRLLLQRSPIDG